MAADNVDENPTSSANQEDEPDVPKDIKFDTIIVDVAFHPEKDVIACADIDGDLAVYSYSTKEENHELLHLTHHKKSCRAVRFSPNGQRMFSVSKDKTLQCINLDRGSVEHCISKAHKSAPYSLLVVDDNMVASGDDDGTLKVWDMRTQQAVMDVQENEDFISDMVIEKSNRLLLATSGDGTLTSFDIRKHKMKMQSELFDSELLSLAMMKRGEKIVCGSGEGVLNIFNWGEFGNISDRFPGHPESIDCMIPLSDDVIVTGSIDGILRAVNILPNRLIGVVGEHEEFPVENMALSHCRRLIASCSHDQTVRFWDVSDACNQKVDGSKKIRKNKQNKILNKAKAAKDDFFADMMDGEDEKDSDNEEDSDDSDMDSDNDIEGDDDANDDEDKQDGDDSDSDSDKEETG